MTVKFDLHREGSSVLPTLIVPLSSVRLAGLTIANRALRQKGTLFQAKHAEFQRVHGIATRDRLPGLAELNMLIEWHRDRFLAMHDLYLSTAPQIAAFGMGDLTANLLRPHCIVNPRRSFFWLAGEPFRQVEYTLLVFYAIGKRVAAEILHRVRVGDDGQLPSSVPQTIRDGALFWAACPPLLENGEFDPFRFALLDYDIRHWKTFPRTDEGKEEMWEFYRSFGDHEEWEDRVRAEVDSAEAPVDYHAACGVTDNEEIVVIHRAATPEDLALTLKNHHVRDGVLLDTGGSPFIWANWLAEEGQILACNHEEFRPRRGAVVSLATDGPIEVSKQTNPAWLEASLGRAACRWQGKREVRNAQA